LSRKTALVLLLVAVSVAATGLLGDYLSKEQAHLVPISYPTSPHSNVIIGRDSDFTTVGAEWGCRCVRTGSGTERDPYVISGWTLNASASDGISISGTSAHFVIREVTIYGNLMHTGILLNRVKSARIEGCLIRGNFVGVYAFSTANLAFINNTVQNNQYGIRLEASNKNLLSANEFVGNELAIFVRGSGNVLKNNRVARSTFGAINIDGTGGSADDNLIEANVVTDGGYGIAMWRARNCVIRGNNVTRNGVGITLTDASENNIIDGNTVTHSGGNGVAVEGNSSNNIVEQNVAIGNGDGVSTFDLLDSSVNNVWQNNTYVTKKPDTLQRS
jgi:parallel beta-helix repeat protein